ncbi:hypothetical protein [Arenibacter certesii]|uniref:Uncharacterized protein n=1 Tax=Arenibacter certesii TaxID=228955 RepID=A0A918IZV0_9FLAO|nr:hypothetical protein [Arenibacter certesii]GGW40375.1 hypothetical protein GCM10007383_26360 [Arenibacter certesii]
MKNVLFMMLLIPVMAISHSGEGYAVLENGMITPNPAKITEFESGLAAHNKTYHGSGIFGARVYWIANGKNTGSYVWVMGPIPWSEIDKRPAQKEHDTDWNKNVLPYVLPQGDQTYWRFHPELSNFQKDVTLKNLLVAIYDIKRMKSKEMIEMLKKVHNTMVEKFPEETFSMYTNEMPSMTDGQDLAFVSFFEKLAWMGLESKFSQKFDEVNGPGSFEKFLKDWEDITHGKYSSEMWIYREDLSGLDGEIKAISRQ